MAARMSLLTTLFVFLLTCGNAYAGSIVDRHITAEIILDGMTHFDADQGLKDYKVEILEVTLETDRPEVIQREKVYYFMAPNVYLNLVGGKPETLSNDASFMLLLSQYNLKREADEVVRGEACYKVVATPRESAYTKYNKTYYVSKADFRKIRIESIRAEMDYEFTHYKVDYFYDRYEDGENEWLLVRTSKAIKYDKNDNVLMEQTNDYRNYEFDRGLTRDFFEKILKEYNYYFSEGT